MATSGVQPPSPEDGAGAQRVPMHPGDEAPDGATGTAQAVCRRCGGSGRWQDRPCPDCGGTGKIVQGVGGG
jgi:DnaJ-class molecular chaperone